MCLRSASSEKTNKAVGQVREPVLPMHSWASLTLKVLERFVANLWTEFAAHRSEALSTNGKELQNP